MQTQHSLLVQDVQYTMCVLVKSVMSKSFCQWLCVSCVFCISLHCFSWQEWFAAHSNHFWLVYAFFTLLDRFTHWVTDSCNSVCECIDGLTPNNSWKTSGSVSRHQIRRSILWGCNILFPCAGNARWEKYIFHRGTTIWQIWSGGTTRRLESNCNMISINAEVKTTVTGCKMWIWCMQWAGVCQSVTCMYARVTRSTSNYKHACSLPL